MILDIPPDFAKLLLPPNQLSVLQFLQFPIPLLMEGPSTNAEAFIVQEEPESFDLDEVGCIVAAPMPYASILDSIWKEVEERISNGECVSIVTPTIPQSHRFPPWILTYWTAIAPSQVTQVQWKAAAQNLTSHSQMPPLTQLVNEIQSTLSKIPWTAKLCGFPISLGIESVTAYTSTEWLTDNHEAQLLHLLQTDLAAGPTNVDSSDIEVLDIHFLPLLRKAYKEQEAYYTAKSWRWMREKGHVLGSEEPLYMAAIVHVEGIHWAALVLDVKERTLWYGDSMGWAIEDEVKETLLWWTFAHSGRDFSFRHLPISRQIDGHSCGLLAWNALASFFLEDVDLCIPMSVAQERLNVMKRILEHHEANISMLHEAFDLPLDVEDDTDVAGDVEWFDDDGRSEDERTESAVSSDNEEPSPTNVSTLSLASTISALRTTSLKTPSTSSLTSPILQPPAKKQKVESNTRVALEFLDDPLNRDPTPRGILGFFSKATDEEKRAQRARTMEKEEERLQEIKHRQKQMVSARETSQKEKDRMRQRKHRERQKRSEIRQGIRSPGGTKKRKISELSLEILKDDNQTMSEPGPSFAELSRPARKIITVFKEKTRKPQGRKRKHAPRPAKYNNWHTPACFSQILLVAKVVGPKMSATEMVKELQKRDPKIFANISRTTVNSWIDRRGPRARWKDSIQAKINAGTGNMPGHNKGGRRGILALYPDITKEVKDLLERLRESGAPLTVVTVRGILVAKILQRQPKVFAAKFRDGSTFKASESFVRNFLRREVGWSMRHSTRATQKMPKNWEDICEKSFLRMAYVIKEEDIPDALYVNSDQTQVVYAPGNRMTWAPVGTKQVYLVGADEKRAFTLLVSVASDGTLLPFQAIYKGETKKSCPSKKAPCLDEVEEAGFRLEFSGTSTYWSNQQTMQLFVDEILAPYFERAKSRLGLPLDQRCLWQIDVWSVHRSEEFRTWMATHHPLIILSYVPGGCTGVFQPCDVGIQRALKLSIRRSYHEDIVDDMVQQMEKSLGDPVVDERLGILRDRSVRWLWNAFQALNNRDFVKKAFKLCKVKGKWDLSYETLSGRAARQELRDLKKTDLAFWEELSAGKQVAIPSEAEKVAEDLDEEAGTELEDLPSDDCDVSISKFVDAFARDNLPAGCVTRAPGAYMSAQMAENLEQVEEDDIVEAETAQEMEEEEEELGRGKRKRVANKFYAANSFWRHKDDEGSDVDEK